MTPDDEADPVITSSGLSFLVEVLATVAVLLSIVGATEIAIFVIAPAIVVITVLFVVSARRDRQRS